MKFLPATVAATLIYAQLGCVQAGEDKRPSPPPMPEAAQGVPCDPSVARCIRLPPRDPLEPAVPPVPNSPLNIECQKLPTQVERDTCVNRKQSTG